MPYYLGFPVGTTFGWGICGRYCSLELARLHETYLLTKADPAQGLAADPLAALDVSRLIVPRERWQALPREGSTVFLDGPLLVSINNQTMEPQLAGVKSSRTVGYTFFEENVLSPEQLAAGRQHYQAIATGSSWNTEILQDYGLTNVSTAVQGVDRQIFHPRPEGKTLLRDRFVVFSGGKFEFRKGQDVVIRAYKVLQDRHPDVLLVNSWFNHWNWSRDTMAASPLIRFRPSELSHVPAMNQMLAEHGIDASRVITLPAQPNVTLAYIYQQTDVGLFPNRAEGGTNLVLMEYLASGKPVIATATTGHRDIVTDRNALVIPCPRTITINDAGGRKMAEWPEPDLDATIERLEWAYQNRARLEPLGIQAGADMAQWPWSRTAVEFARLLAD